MANRYGYIINSDGTTAPLSDPHALHRGEAAPNAENLGGNPPAYYTPYDNRVDNGNFRKFVAQAGIGGNHGTQAYGGDRWILDSGTITGTENTNGLGYGSITLNGTIRQIIAEPKETMTAFVGMISGTATVAYTYTDGTGELTISSAGGVLDWLMLLPGEWESAPPYVPKGYAAELAECLFYYELIKALTAYSPFCNVFFQTEELAIGAIQYSEKRLSNPSVDSSPKETFRIRGTAVATLVERVSTANKTNKCAMAYLEVTGGTKGEGGQLQANNTTEAFIEICADL